MCSRHLFAGHRSTAMVKRLALECLALERAGNRGPNNSRLSMKLLAGGSQRSFRLPAEIFTWLASNYVTCDVAGSSGSYFLCLVLIDNLSKQLMRPLLDTALCQFHKRHNMQLVSRLIL